MKKTTALLKIIIFLKQFRKEAVLASFIILLELCFKSLSPLFSKILIDQALPARDLKLLVVMVILYFSFMGFEGLMNFINVRIFSGINKKIYVQIRTTLFRHLQTLSVKFYSKKKGGELLTRLVYDVDNLENLLMSTFLNIIKNLLLMAAIYVLMFFLNIKIGLFTLISLPVFIFLINQTSGSVFKIAEKFQLSKEKLTGNLQENISGMKLIKTYNLEKHFGKKIEDEIKKTEELKRQNDIKSSLSALSGHVILLVASAIIWGIGGLEMINGNLTIGAFFALFTYFQFLTTPISELFSAFIMMQNSLSSAKRIFETLEIEAENREEDNLPVLEKVEGRIVFSNVSLNYESRGEIIRDINLTIEPGEIVAIVGHSGVGKTSLINLIMKFYSPANGTVYIDNYDLSRVKGTSIRNHVALVSQDTFIFNSTMRENITLGNIHIPFEEVIEAARMLNLHEFIEGLPDGYNTMVGERGLQISGGQRKLIDLCRALLKKPKILILDEATSELDSITESIIKNALLCRLKGKMTVIIISHRIATLSWINKIIVMKNGMIDEIGSHETLINSNSLYRELYKNFTYSPEAEASKLVL